MKSVLIFVFLSLSQCYFTSGQHLTPDTANLFTIQRIDISDTHLINYIKEYINRNKNSNKYFADGLGFVTIKNPDFRIGSGRPLNMDSDRNLSSLNLAIQAYPLQSKFGYEGLYSNFYPPYYTFVNDKIVLIYEENTMALLGRGQANDWHTNRFYTNESRTILTELIASHAIIDLPDDYIFNEHLHAKDYILTMEMVRKSSKKPEDVYLMYEFINFKADETIYYDPELYQWMKVEEN